MIKIKKPKPDKVITTEMTLAEETFEIDLMPITEEERIEAFKPFRRRRSVENPRSKQMELVTFFDDDNPGFKRTAEDLLCKVVVNFRGIGDADGNSIDGTVRENKILLGSLKIKDIEDISVVDENGQAAFIKQPRERYFRALILDKAVELSQATAEAETKNS